LGETKLLLLASTTDIRLKKEIKYNKKHLKIKMGTCKCSCKDENGKGDDFATAPNQQEVRTEIKLI
jgi:hypothetical protein